MQETVGQKVQRNRKGAKEKTAAAGDTAVSREQAVAGSVPENAQTSAKVKIDKRPLLTVERFWNSPHIYRLLGCKSRYAVNLAAVISGSEVAADISVAPLPQSRRQENREWEEWEPGFDYTLDSISAHDVRRWLNEYLSTGRGRFCMVLSDAPQKDFRDGPNVSRPFVNQSWAVIDVNVSDYVATPCKDGATVVFDRKPEQASTAALARRDDPETLGIKLSDQVKQVLNVRYHPLEVRERASVEQIETETRLPRAVIETVRKSLLHDTLVLPDSSLAFWRHLANNLDWHIGMLSMDTVADCIWMWAQDFRRNYVRNGGWPQEMVDVADTVKRAKTLALRLKQARQINKTDFVLSRCLPGESNPAEKETR